MSMGDHSQAGTDLQGGYYYGGVIFIVFLILILLFLFSYPYRRFDE